MSRTCSCSVSRREFVAMMGISAAALLASPGWARWIEKQGAPDELGKWKADLMMPSAPRKYVSSIHKDVHFPLGGIGAGNIEMGADGNLTTWHLWNNLREGTVPLHFAVRAGDKALLLQTAGGPNWPRVKSIVMVGEYPTADLHYVDGAIPVDLTMSVYSPFAPLDSRLSSMPAACFTFKVHNRSNNTQTISLAAFSRNVIGYEGAGDINEIINASLESNLSVIENNAKFAGVLMSAIAGDDGSVNNPVDVYTNAEVERLTSPASGHPKGLSYNKLDKLPTADKLGTHTTLIVLEDLPVDYPVDMLKRITDLAKAGARVAFTGDSQPLISAYGRLIHGKPLAQTIGKADIVFENFENGYDEWKVEGTAFGDKPATGTFPSQQQVSGFKGKGLINSWIHGDDDTGKLTSRDFTVERNYIRFLIGGGHWPTTQIRLIQNGKIVRAQSGRDLETLDPMMWDVSEFKGKTAHIEIVDEQKGAWGHVNVDEIVFTDEPADRTVMEALAELLPMQFEDFKAYVQTEGKSVKLSSSQNFSFFETSNGKGIVMLCAVNILSNSRTDNLPGHRNIHSQIAALSNVQYTSQVGIPAHAHGFGTAALGLVKAGAADISVATKSTIEVQWQNFVKNGKFEDAINAEGKAPSVAVSATLVVEPGKTVETSFFYAWCFPNRYSGALNVGNFYSTIWKDAKAVAHELSASLPAIRKRMDSFRKTVYDSTMPYWMTDCVTSQMSTIRQPGIVFQLAKGDIYGWEGSNGCCQPTCTHVWGYEQSLAYLFPDLEREMRRIDYKDQQIPSGGINNRTDFPSPPHPTGERPFTDGHASCVLKAYREAINQPDDKWMREYWPFIKKAVDYLVDRDAADAKPDGVLEDDQWNTYDEAIHGVNTFIGTYYLAALRAGEELAKRMGDAATAERYHSIFESGSKRLDELCWNGEYYEQNLKDYMTRGGEYGPGCLADQLIGQWWAHQLGLGYLLPKEHVRKALQFVFKYNFLPDHTNWKHNWRKFAGGKDKGLLICTWPKGGRPANPVMYCDEVWTGIEYQVASHMIYEGLLEEAFAIVKGARDRYDGIPRDPIGRNPWNEIECGGHYARAMSSWSLLHAMNGYRYDGPRGLLCFAPAHKAEDHRSFFVSGEGWGGLRQTRKGRSQRSEVHMEEGQIAFSELHLQVAGAPGKATIILNGKSVKAGFKRTDNDVVLTFSRPVVLNAGDKFSVNV